MRPSQGGREAGFSLVELLVTMVITLMVSGAIYGLLASGQNAFRKEPEVADRQQNIRVAMDVITKDIVNAGANLPAFVQVFTRTDPDNSFLNGKGPLGGALGSAGQGQRTAGDTALADVLEIVEAEDQCPAQTVCGPTPQAAGQAGTFAAREPNPACLSRPGFTVMTDNVNMTIQPLLAFATAQCPTGGAARNGSVTLGAAVQVGSNPAAPALTAPTADIAAFLFKARVVRYMIDTGTDPLDTAPMLWRSVTGQYDGAGVISAAPSGGGAAWQPVARGIEDLQVEYMDGTNTWANSPPAAIACGAPGTCTNIAAYGPIVRQVRVTLSARATAPLLSGQTRVSAGGVGPDAIRGQMVTVTQPRAAFTALQIGGQTR